MSTELNQNFGDFFSVLGFFSCGNIDFGFGC